MKHVLAAASLSLVGCLPEIPHDEVPAAVVAEFDPSAEPSPRIPSPTDLVYDTTTGHLLVEVGIRDAGVAWDLAEFLNELDGWPASMPAKCTFTAPVDPSTVNAGTVRVLDITDAASPVPVDDARLILEDGGTELLIHPGLFPTWEVGRRYAIAITGGQDGVRGAAGEEVIPSSVFWFFRSDLPLASCEECPEGTHDADGDPWNGCEYACVPTGGIEDCEDGIDSECDGRSDPDDPECAECYPEYCNGRDDDCDREIDEDFDLAADAENCGECGNVCPEVQGGSRTCTLGACGFACDPGCADGDGDPSNGCEAGCDPEAPPAPLSCTSLTSLMEDQDAGDLEEARGENAEVFRALEAAAVPREEVALAWSFRTSSRVVVPFDPSVDDVHFPNDYYLTEDETSLEVPPPEGSTPAAEALLARLNALDGYSLTGAGWIRFVGPLDGTSRNLTPTALLVMNADEDEDLPLFRRSWDASRSEVMMEPLRSLHSHTRYAAIALKYLLDEEGEEIISSHVWTILKSEHPVADAEGRSLLSSVSDEDAVDLEEARQEYAELFEELADASYPRWLVRVGVVFTTQSVVPPMQSLGRIPYARGIVTAASAPLGVQDPATRVPAGMPRASLLGVVDGTIQGADLVDPASGEIDETSTETKDLAFVLALPIAPPPGRDAAPVVVVQHDIGGSPDDLFALADALASEGFASIGIGLPAGATLSAENPFATADSLRQHAVDLATLVRSLGAADGPSSITGVDLDTGDISFVGAGYGAMAGTLFLAVDPAIRVCVLSGAGGNLGLIAGDSIEAWLGDDLGLEPGSEAHHFFRYAWSWAADRGDPGIFAHHLVDAPLADPDGSGTMEPKRLLVQIPEEDDVIPLASMEFFFLSAGTEIYPEYHAAGHGALLDAGDPAGDAMRERAVAFVAAGGE